MTLFEINAALEAAFERAIDPETGEILDEQAKEELDNLQMFLDDKIENIACWIKNLKADAEALKNEKLAFAKRQAAAENKVKSLEKYLAYALGEGNKFQSAKVSIGWRKSDTIQLAEGKSVYDIDTKYLKLAEPELKKADLKAAIKAGEVIDGIELVTKQNMQIK